MSRSSREAFEEAAFAQRYLHSIRHVGNKGPLSLQSVDCPDKQEFLRRRPDGHYEDKTLNMLWWAWMAATKHAMEVVDDTCMSTPIAQQIKAALGKGLD